MAKRRNRRRSRRVSRRRKRDSGFMSKNMMYWLIGAGIAAGIFVKFLLPRLQTKVLNPTVTLGPLTIAPAAQQDYSNYNLDPNAAIMGLGALLNG